MHIAEEETKDAPVIRNKTETDMIILRELHLNLVMEKALKRFAKNIMLNFCVHHLVKKKLMFLKN